MCAVGLVRDTVRWFRSGFSTLALLTSSYTTTEGTLWHLVSLGRMHSDPLGMYADNLYQSVRFGLEGAILSAAAVVHYPYHCP